MVPWHEGLDESRAVRLVETYRTGLRAVIRPDGNTLSDKSIETYV